MAERTTPPIRGRRGRDRRLAEDAASTLAARHRPIRDEDAVDFDLAAVDAEAEDAAPRQKPAAMPGCDARRPKRRPAAEPRSPNRHRLPDLASLPPLLAATGSFASLRERLGSPDDDPRRVGRHAGLVAVPHGAKSYLAAALALADTGERLAWIARDAEIGDRVAEELGAWLGDPEAVVVLEPRTALAYERSELVADETAARVAALAAWRSGRARVLVAGVQALLQHTMVADDLPAEPRRLRRGLRLHQDALLRDLFGLGYVPVLEVAGRGEFAKRGGIVDVFPPSLPLPIRIEFFGDEIDSLRAFDPTDQRTVRSVEDAVLLPASEFLLPAGGAAAIRAGLGRAAAKLPERLDADLTRFEGAEDDRLGPSGRAAAKPTGETRAMVVGDAAEVWAAHLAPATGLDHLGPGTLLVLDEPGDIAEAAEFLWRQADERRAELIGAGELPKDWPSTYLPSKDWKARLTGSRTLELTWESDPAVGTAMARGALSSGDVFGWREPTLPFGRAAGVVDAVAGWRADGARIVLASDQAARLADLLEEAGQSVAVVERIAEPPPPGAVDDRRPEPERRVHRRTGRADLRDGPRAVRDRPGPPAAGAAAGRAARHPRAADARRPRRPYRPRRGAVRADDAAIVGHGRRARLPRALVRGGRPHLRPGRADRPRQPLLGRASARRSRSWAAPSGCAPSSASARPSRTSPRSCSRCTPRGPRRRATRSRRTRRGRPRWRRRSRTRRPSTSSAPRSRSRPTWSGSARWTGSSSATSATARPRSRCGPPSRRRRTARQVAVLVPTTVLAAQHHETFSQRFAAFPLEVRLLSRFVPAKEQAATVEGLADGTVDIVIGTHRLLSARTSGSRTSAWSSSTRSSGSASPPRSGSSSSAPRWTC